jgi:hypothetical protein
MPRPPGSWFGFSEEGVRRTARAGESDYSGALAVPTCGPAFPLRRFIALAAHILIASTVGCASRSAPRVTSLGDGVFTSPAPEEAEAYCRNFGAPMRFFDPKQRAGAPAGEVTFRCD